jgi:hypothetical protein
MGKGLVAARFYLDLVLLALRVQNCNVLVRSWDMVPIPSSRARA